MRKKMTLIFMLFVASRLLALDSNVYRNENVSSLTTLSSIEYSKTPTKDITVNVFGDSQTITFTALADKIYGDATFDLIATASSGLSVTYVSSDTSVATISGNTVTIIAAGTTNITASQSGDATFDAALDVVQNLTVNTRAITVTADETNKAESTTDPSFTYQITTGSLAFSDEFTGSLTRVAGETQGDYAIQQGTLALSANYTLTFVDGQFSIVAAIPATALNFDGSSTTTYDYISVPDNNDLDLTTSFTFEAWVSFDQINRINPALDWRAFFNKSRYNESYGLMVYVPSRLMRFYHAGMGGGFTDYTWSSLIPNTWYHVAVSLSATESKIYINGVEVKNNTFAASSLAQNDEPLFIGSSKVVNGDPYPFDGSMEEVRLWNTTRTATEINNYKDYELNGDETGLVLNYNFNQGNLNVNNTPITTVTDNSTNGYDGSLNQFAMTGTISNFVGSGANVATKSSQTITFGALSNVMEDAVNFDLTATSDSGLAVSYTSSNTAVATVSESTVSIVGAGETTITANQPGNFQYNAATAIPQTLTVDAVLGIDTENSGNRIALYPNPISEVLRIRIENNLEAKVEIYNSYGQKVLNTSDYISDDEISMKNLASGIYIVKVYNNDQVILKKVIKK